MALGHDSRSILDVPHRVDDLRLRLPLVALVEDLLASGALWPSGGSHVLLNVNLSLHAAFRRWKVLEHLARLLVVPYPESLLDYVLFVIVADLELEGRGHSDLLCGRPLRSEFLRATGCPQERPLLDHFCSVVKATDTAVDLVLWGGGLGLDWQLAVLEVDLLVSVVGMGLSLGGVVLGLGHVLVKHVGSGRRCKRLID